LGLPKVVDIDEYFLKLFENIARVWFFSLQCSNKIIFLDVQSLGALVEL